MYFSKGFSSAVVYSHGECSAVMCSNGDCSAVMYSQHGDCSAVDCFSFGASRRDDSAGHVNLIVFFFDCFISYWLYLASQHSSPHSSRPSCLSRL